jgi:hypothetical protein
MLGELQMEEAHCCLARCKSGKEVAEKIWTMSADQQLKVIVWMWRWWTTRNKANAGERVKVLGRYAAQSITTSTNLQN